MAVVSVAEKTSSTFTQVQRSCGKCIRWRSQSGVVPSRTRNPNLVRIHQVDAESEGPSEMA